MAEMEAAEQPDNVNTNIEKEDECPLLQWTDKPVVLENLRPPQIMVCGAL